MKIWRKRQIGRWKNHTFFILPQMDNSLFDHILLYEEIQCHCTAVLSLNFLLFGSLVGTKLMQNLQLPEITMISVLCRIL